MARTDTLGNFLTDVADAIREKKGTSETIQASDFDTEIENLPSGGGDLDEYINTTISENTAYNNTFANRFIIKPLEININSSVTSLQSAFSNFPAEIIFKNVDTSNVTTIEYTFSNSIRIKNIDLSKFDFSNVKNINGTFQNCSNLKTINFGNITFSNYTGFFENFFKNCSSLEEVDTSKFSSTTQAPRYMFSGCKKLKKIDLSNLTVSGGFMWANFENCTSLEFLDIRKFDLTSLTQFNASNFTGVPANCEIIVGTENDKNAILNLRSDFTNIKTVEEYEAE